MYSDRFDSDILHQIKAVAGFCQCDDDGQIINTCFAELAQLVEHLASTHCASVRIRYSAPNISTGDLEFSRPTKLKSEGSNPSIRATRM